MPPAPADVALVRASFAPGSGFPLDPADPALALVYIQSGALAVRAVTELQVTRVVVAGTPVAAEVTAAGVETVLGPGDSAVFPPFIAGEIRNAGTEPAVVLALLVEPTETAATPVAEATPAAAATPVAGATPGAEGPPEGIGFQALAFGHTPELPVGPAGLAIVRLTAGPGTVFPPDPTEGVELVYVEAGSFTLRGEEGPAFEVVRGLEAMATPGAAPTVEAGEPGQDVTVGAGEAVFFPSGNVAGARAGEDETAVALLAIIEPVAGP